MSFDEPAPSSVVCEREGKFWYFTIYHAGQKHPRRGPFRTQQQAVIAGDAQLSQLEEPLS